jgi:hypothetical protein
MTSPTRRLVCRLPRRCENRAVGVNVEKDDVDELRPFQITASETAGKPPNSTPLPSTSGSLFRSRSRRLKANIAAGSRYSSLSIFSAALRLCAVYCLGGVGGVDLRRSAARGPAASGSGEVAMMFVGAGRVGVLVTTAAVLGAGVASAAGGWRIVPIAGGKIGQPDLFRRSPAPRQRAAGASGPSGRARRSSCGTDTAGRSRLCHCLAACGRAGSRTFRASAQGFVWRLEPSRWVVTHPPARRMASCGMVGPGRTSRW